MVVLRLCESWLISINTKASRGRVSKRTPIAWSEKGATWFGPWQGCHRRWSALWFWAETHQDESYRKAVICWVGRTENKFIWHILLWRILTQHWITVHGICFLLADTAPSFVPEETHNVVTKGVSLGHQSKPSHDSSFICALTEYDPYWWAPAIFWSTYTFISRCATTEVFKAGGHFVGDLSDADIHLEDTVRFLRLETSERTCEPMK